jgi:hypothetical protein
MIIKSYIKKYYMSNFTTSTDFAHQIEIIEKLLRSQRVAYSKEVRESDLLVSFKTAKSANRVLEMLNAQSIDCAAEEMQMYISLALPDALLNGTILKESSDENVERKVGEYAVRLQFMLKNTLGFSVHPTPTKSKLKVRHIIVVGENGTRRIDFADCIEKNTTEKQLIEAGFYCSMPANSEKTTIIVDLYKSQQKVLLQNIKAMLTLKEIKERILTNSEIKVTSQGQPKVKGISHITLMFTNKEEAKIAAGMFKNDIEGVTAKLRAMIFPSSSVKKETGGGSPKIKKGKSLPLPSIATISAEPTSVATADALFIQLKQLLREEIEAELKDANYFIPKNSTSSVTIPISELGKGVVVDGIKGITVKVELFAS